MNMFKHPGTLMSPEMTRGLKTIKETTPYLKNLTHLLNDLYEKPQACVKTKVTVKDHDAMVADGANAYIFTIGYLYTNNDTYATKALSMIKNWVDNNRGFDAGVNAWHLGNGPLEFGWMIASFSRVAEILKYTFMKWSVSFESSFNSWIDTIVLPILKENRNLSGNWCSTICEARIQLSIFRNDKNEFTNMIENIKKCIHNDIDDHGIYVETFRDLWHAQAGIAGLIQGAEIAWHQGVDLFSYKNNALGKCAELHAHILNIAPDYPPIIKQYIDLSKKQPLLSKAVYRTIWPYAFDHWPREITNRVYWPAAYEIVLSHYPSSMMTETKKIVERHRPEPYYFHHGFGTYTHFLTCKTVEKPKSR